MKEINIAESDVAAIASRIKEFAARISDTSTSIEDSRPPAIKVIHCVLSLRANYDKVVRPRLATFMTAHPDIKQVAELANLIANYPTPYAFITSALNYKSKWKGRILQSVVRYVGKIVEEAPTVSEEDALKQWAINFKPQECYTLKIKGFKLAGFQYLRMLFGADTAKPDVHVIRFLSNTLNRKVSAIESLFLLEAASKRVGLPVRAVDSYIWRRGARGQQDSTKLNTVRLTPEVAAAFPTEEAVNEALRFALKVIGDIEHLTHHVTPAAENNQTVELRNNDIPEEFRTEYSEFWDPIRAGELGELFAGPPTPDHNKGWLGNKTIPGVEVWLRLINRKCYIRLYFLKPNHFERRDKIMPLFPKSDYDYTYKDTDRVTTVIFSVLDKGKNDKDDWEEIREKLVAIGTDIYNKINESDL